jgi:hypothetical protein
MNANVAGLFVAEGKMVAAQTKFSRIAQGGAANDFNGRALAEAHL